MSISTRANYYPSTPKHSPTRREGSSRTWTRFFDALDRSGCRKSKRQIYKEYAPSRPTGQRWEAERKRLGSPAYHRTRPQSEKPLGKIPTANRDVCEMLVDPTRNLKRTQSLAAQLAFHDIKVKPRALQVALKKYTNGGQKYKQAYIAKELSVVNKTIRVEHGEEHKGQPIIGFWDRVFFTDEAHIDLSALRTG
jgi:hypothetical protein